jgi:hypothetical protein
MMAFHRRVFPGSIVQPVISWAFAIRADAEQAAERIEGIEAAVKAERELVEVGLQMLGADRPVMRAVQPSFEVAENKVDDRQVFFGDLGIVGLRDRQMVVSQLAKPIVAAPCVCDDHGARLYRRFYKGRQGLGAARGRDFQAKPAGIATTTASGLVAFLSGPRADFDGADNQRHVVSAAPFTFGLSPDPGFVNLDMIAARQVAADPVTPSADHAGAKLMQDSERRLVSLDFKLALELHGRNARNNGRGQIGAPKPRRQWCMRPGHHGPNCQRRLLAAFAAGQDAGPRRHAERLAFFVAMRALKALRPLGTLQISGARGIVREQPLKVPERLGKRQVFPLQHVGVRGHGLSPPRQETSRSVPFRLPFRPFGSAKLARTAVRDRTAARYHPDMLFDGKPMQRRPHIWRGRNQLSIGNIFFGWDLTGAATHYRALLDRDRSGSRPANGPDYPLVGTEDAFLKARHDFDSFDAPWAGSGTGHGLTRHPGNNLGRGNRPLMFSNRRPQLGFAPQGVLPPRLPTPPPAITAQGDAVRRPHRNNVVLHLSGFTVDLVQHGRPPVQVIQEILAQVSVCVKPIGMEEALGLVDFVRSHVALTNRWHITNLFLNLLTLFEARQVDFDQLLRNVEPHVNLERELDVRDIYAENRLMAARLGLCADSGQFRTKIAGRFGTFFERYGMAIPYFFIWS